MRAYLSQKSLPSTNLLTIKILQVANCLHLIALALINQFIKTDQVRLGDASILDMNKLVGRELLENGI